VKLYGDIKKSENIVDLFFNDLNKQKNETISYSEWIKMVSNKNNMLSEKNLKTVFTLIDTDKSGNID